VLCPLGEDAVPQGTLSRLTAIHLVNPSLEAWWRHPCCRYLAKRAQHRPTWI